MEIVNVYVRMNSWEMGNVNNNAIVKFATMTVGIALNLKMTPQRMMKSKSQFSSY